MQCLADNAFDPGSLCAKQKLAAAAAVLDVQRDQANAAFPLFCLTSAASLCMRMSYGAVHEAGGDQ
jgi:hypothetical protein